MKTEEILLNTESLIKISVEDWISKKDKLLSLVNFKSENDYVPSGEPHTPSFTDFGIDKEYTSEDFFSILGLNINSFFGKDNLVCYHVWCQRYVGSASMNIHDHGSSGISGVLYTEFDPSVHQATTFMSSGRNPWTGGTVYQTPDVNEGDLILFPSYLMHYARPSLTTIPRTIFSFNIGY